MKSTKTLIAMLMAVAVLAACRSSRHAMTDATTSASPVYTPPSESTGQGTDDTASSSRKDKDKDGRKKKSPDSQQHTRPNVDAMTAKLNLTLESGNKQINVGGTYRLKRNEVVQINLTYTMLFSINVGTMELTPDYVLLIDRINKRYCRVNYDEAPELAQTGISFDYLQRVFWGEAAQSPTKTLEWGYSNWTDFEDGQFPGRIQFTLKASSSAYKATIDLSNLRANGDWDSHTEVSSKYTPVSLDTVMRALMSVAK